MIITVNADGGKYNIYIKRGLISKLPDEINLQRKVLIITDSGVPAQYSDKILSASKEGYILTIEKGEKSKNLSTYESIMAKLLELNFTRDDAVVAVGGGVVGDLSGFAASTYMRGIEFYNIPTTLLSQVDSSIGGKTAVDFNGIKNIIGTFYQPSAVVIDPDVLNTLDKREFSAGLAEVIKMAAIHDANLFEYLEENDICHNIEYIIEKSLLIKKYFVESDTKENGVRRALNFGHTIGHAIEVSVPEGGLLHGECVGIGMLYCSEKAVRDRLQKLLIKANLPYKYNADVKVLKDALIHDKKASHSGIKMIIVNKIGSYEVKLMNCDEIIKLI